jgi:hypothetical protein
MSYLRPWDRVRIVSQPARAHPAPHVSACARLVSCTYAVHKLLVVGVGVIIATPTSSRGPAVCRVPPLTIQERAAQAPVMQASAAGLPRS